MEEGKSVNIEKLKSMFNMLEAEFLCSYEDLKKSYRRVIKKYHPDNGISPSTLKARQAISAFKILEKLYNLGEISNISKSIKNFSNKQLDFSKISDKVKKISETLWKLLKKNSRTLLIVCFVILFYFLINDFLVFLLTSITLVLVTNAVLKRL